MQKRRLTLGIRVASYVWGSGSVSVRLVLVAAMMGSGLGSGLGAGAQSLPATQPTVPATAAVAQATAAAAQATAAAAATAAPLRPEQLAATRARIAFNGRVLQITADNSSLNQILREVARVTGMKVTGGVIEERVYGVYGPADPESVLTALLEGTGSNMLLMVDRQRKPTELVLTPRQGGVTPPSPNAQGHDAADDEPDLPPQLAKHVQRGRVPLPEPQAPPPAQAAAEPVAPARPAEAPTTNEQSPNGVKTPQQIYDQLLKLQQQKPKP